jgi:hypothetical protein
MLVFQDAEAAGGMLILAKGLDVFALAMLIVQVMSHRYIHAAIAKWGFMIVVTVKTRGYAVSTLVLKFRQHSTDVNKLIIA